MISYFLAFIAVVVLDFVWAIYTRHVTSGNSVKAGLYASAIFITNAYVVVEFVNDVTVVIPAVLGAFVGTSLAVEWDKRNNNVK